jgi:hypothetical protein
VTDGSDVPDVDVDVRPAVLDPQPATASAIIAIASRVLIR